ncbi:hypothetical protein OIO90_001684 [Microbotryomycetes sp. JL221]|nr:hypothetical protein OIO90_001684 [Microbotryomycetes sp. JL221]
MTAASTLGRTIASAAATTTGCTCHRASSAAAGVRRRRSRAASTLVLDQHASHSISQASSSSSSTTPSTAQLVTDVRQLLRRYPLLQHTSWLARLDQAHSSLQHASNTTIAIIGDKHSGLTQLVTATLDDPLATDTQLSVTLAARRLHKDTPEAIAISYGTKPSSSRHDLTVPSSWLKTNNIHLVEILHGDVPPRNSSFDSLFASDAIVLVLADSRGYSASGIKQVLAEFESKPLFIIAANSPLDPTKPSIETVEAQLDRLLPGSNLSSSSSNKPDVITLSTKQAIDAIQTLSPTEPQHKPSYEQFSRRFIDSGVPQFMDKLQQIASTNNVPSIESTNSSTLRLASVRHVIKRAIETSALEGGQIAAKLYEAKSDIAALTFVTTESTKTVLTALGIQDGLLKIPTQDVQEAVNALNELLNSRLTWYRLPSRVDDIVAEIATVTSSTYLLSFENSLAFSTGRLTSLATTLSNKTDELVQTRAFAPDTTDTSSNSDTRRQLSSLYSPLLLNKLAQASFDSLNISSTCLSSNVVNRRNQITSPGGPAEILQRRIQRSIVNNSLLSMSSIATGCLMQLFEFNELSTNLGIGLLGITLSSFFLQKNWIKSKNQFLLDVEKRITGGLEEDLGVAARRLIERATYKARTAVTLSEQILKHKQDDFNQFRQSLSELNDKFKRSP